MTEQLDWAAAFAISEPKAPAKPKPAKPDCAFCQHPESYHCKSGVKHSFYKDEMRQAKSPRGMVCPTRHCTSPICCCVSYQEPSIVK